MSYIENKGGTIMPDEILNRIFSFNGLLRKIFGDLHDNVVFDEEAEFCRNTLKKIYGFNDIDEIFPPVLSKRRFFATLETVFRFANSQESGDKK